MLLRLILCIVGAGFNCYNREFGIVIKDVEIVCGEVSMNLNEELFQKNTASPVIASDIACESTGDNIAMENLPTKQPLSSMTKLSTIFPEKVRVFAMR